MRERKTRTDSVKQRLVLCVGERKEVREREGEREGERWK